MSSAEISALAFRGSKQWIFDRNQHRYHDSQITRFKIHFVSKTMVFINDISSTIILVVDFTWSKQTLLYIIFDMWYENYFWKILDNYDGIYRDGI